MLDVLLWGLKASPVAWTSWGLGINKLQFSVKKRKGKNFICIFSNFWLSKPWIGIRIHLNAGSGSASWSGFNESGPTTLVEMGIFLYINPFSTPLMHSSSSKEGYWRLLSLTCCHVRVYPARDTGWSGWKAGSPLQIQDLRHRIDIMLFNNVSLSFGVLSLLPGSSPCPSSRNPYTNAPCPILCRLWSCALPHHVVLSMPMPTTVSQVPHWKQPFVMR